jgi:hypothetical protein
MDCETVDIDTKDHKKCLPYNYIDDFRLFKEEEIDWRTQNRIHYVLNKGFEGVSNSFLSKTYNHTQPKERILGYENDEVTSHIGVTDDVIFIGAEQIRVGCLGLWVSVGQNRGTARKILVAGMTHLKNKGYKFCLGMTNNKIVIHYIVPRFGGKIKLVDIPIVGQTKASKPGTYAMLFNLDMTENEFLKLEDELLKQGKIVIESEPF